METIQLHASCVAIGGWGVLLLGPSGSGKSDVALRLIDGGAMLCADDRVDVRQHGDILLAAPPPSLYGLLEVHGLGILTLPVVENIPLKLVVDLVLRESVDRLPEPRFFDCLGLRVPLVSLHAFDASTPAKIRFSLRREA